MGSPERTKPQEGSQHQCGMRRRLQFEAVADQGNGTFVGNNRNSSNFTNIKSNTQPSALFLDLETVNASCAESIATSSNKKLTQSGGYSENVLSRLSSCSYRTPEIGIDKVGVSTQSIGTSPVPASGPSGIGLHLNSTGSAARMDGTVNMHLLEKDFEVQGEKSLYGNNDQVAMHSNQCLASIGLTGHHSVKSTTSSGTPMSYSTENNEEKHSMQLKLIDGYRTPCDMKRLPSEDVCRSQELYETSPIMMQRKTLEDENYQRCNCKKSKCLKLYCDCFAAGEICAELCACDDCHNTVDDLEAVSASRKHIESRNPLAFAPKVVLHTPELPKNSLEVNMKPTAARHKKGCNCKKSQCVKKYCQCFQSGVGCSFGCRCESCKNTFGRKDGCGENTEIDHKKTKDEWLERDPSGENLEAEEIITEIRNPEQCHSRLYPQTLPLTPEQCHSRLNYPQTPLQHFSNSGNNTPISQFPRRIYSSPDSGAFILQSSMMSSSSPRESISNNRLGEAREGTAVGSYDSELESHNAVRAGPFSPFLLGFPDLCYLSPSPNPSPSASSAFAASEIIEPRTLPADLFDGIHSSSVGSRYWHDSPVTPLPPLGERKFINEPDSDSELFNNLEADTLEILMDTLYPIKEVKGSPNQKWVAPPHKRLQ